jgi:anti-anti-sigma factor
LVVDVRGVTFMDCAGVRVLLTARKQVEAAGGRLVLAGPSSAVSRLLELTGLSEALPVLDYV